MTRLRLLLGASRQAKLPVVTMPAHPPYVFGFKIFVTLLIIMKKVIATSYI